MYLDLLHTGMRLHALLLFYGTLLLRAHGVYTASFTCGNSNDAATCAALGDLYTATTVTAWSNSDGWSTAAAGTATDYCSFAGLSCDGSGLLTALCVFPAPLAASWMDVRGADSFCLQEPCRLPSFRKPPL